jgi:hypothetical protein
MMQYEKQKEEVNVPDEPEARELLRRAFEKTYRWGKEFKGFSAQLTVVDNGKSYSGSVTVKTPQEIAVSLPNEVVQTWAQGQIGMMAVHRGPRSFEESDGRHVLTLGEEDGHPMGRLLVIHGDGMKSRYRVKDDQITQINRSMGPVRFTINVEDSLTTPSGKKLTTKYSVFYFTAQDSSIKQVESYTDTHAVTDTLYLPGKRRIILVEEGEVRVKTMTFEGHRLL